MREPINYPRFIDTKLITIGTEKPEIIDIIIPTTNIGSNVIILTRMGSLLFKLWNTDESKTKELKQSNWN